MTQKDSPTVNYPPGGNVYQIACNHDGPRMYSRVWVEAKAKEVWHSVLARDGSDARHPICDTFCKPEDFRTWSEPHDHPNPLGIYEAALISYRWWSIDYWQRRTHPVPPPDPYQQTMEWAGWYLSQRPTEVNYHPATWIDLLANQFPLFEHMQHDMKEVKGRSGTRVHPELADPCLIADALQRESQGDMDLTATAGCYLKAAQNDIVWAQSIAAHAIHVYNGYHATHVVMKLRDIAFTEQRTQAAR